ncbi:10718_t:CDS:2 [Ambispora leptoticha]|uniref:protein-tyrosine-phosphatase n=1 Tax=Ambispora leptoticha TaxID=144679 RepID=A0A9N8YSA0_9GLOM|nr:10718_t:CDS:2 [Ambispora leptoticha]
MSVGVCNSPKFEMSNETSYFGNIHHMPGSYIPTPAADSSCSPGYFDLNPKRNSTAQTPFFDAVKPHSPGQTPFFDCETMTSPFFEHLQLQHEQQQSSASASMNSNVKTPGFSIQLPPNSFQSGMITPTWVSNGAFRATLSPKVQRASSTKRPSISNLTPLSSSSKLIFETFTVDSLADLVKRCESNSQNKNDYLVLLLDLRSFSNFTADRIKTALNICIPSTLLKRCSFSPEKIMETLVSDYDKDIFKNWSKYQNIVLYDNDLDIISENCPIFHVCKKFKKENCSAKIGWLKGGFRAFSVKYPELCEQALINTNSKPSTTLPRRKGLNESSRRLGPFTCPTPIIEVAGVNPFFSNIRQNYELSVGITETIPIRLPEGNTFDQTKIPEFMNSLIYGENGRNKLAQIFHDIELTEQKRLQSLMLHNANQATADCPFSISAGMEKGAKNRYHNIWPYDHARVKLIQPGEGGCDYVNASFVQAKGCDTRYIATQGPLPATYDDFWRVIWEQNSRVIVMLTKEEEAGRIQCHRYWAQCTKTPCQFGSLSCILISETNPLVTADGKPDASIIVRKFQIQNTTEPSASPREITQIHFLGWPDFGIPESPCQILKLIDAANEIQSQAAQSCTPSSQAIGPMVVHCSAGCGRTGAFCTIDSVLTQLKNAEATGQKIDLSIDIIKSAVESFREQRLSMVQSLRQFVFCYEAVLWKLLSAA